MCRLTSEQWSSTLDDLLVQSKFKYIISLEETNKTWTRLVTGLPSGQLSFILRAGMDCLPNLKRWKYRSDPSCPLCGSSQATSLHILNGCPTALNQGRYTWRHDSVLKSIASVIKSVCPHWAAPHLHIHLLVSCDGVHWTEHFEQI